MAIIERLARDDRDYERMRALLVEIAARTGPPLDSNVGNLDWWRFHHENPAVLDQVGLWLDDDRVVGIALPDAEEPNLFVHPDCGELLDRMLAWTETRVAADADGSTSATAKTWAYDGDIGRTTILRHRGYQRQSPALHFHSRPLNNDLPAPVLPPGYAIGDLRDATADLVAERVAVHRAAWAPSRMTETKHRAVMASPTYRPDLDLVVIAPDGTYAACCIVWLDAVNGFGLFEPVGTHPDHRRRGLARALMAEGCRRLADLGANQAYVESSSENDSACRLYPAAGFAVVDFNHPWTKTL